MKIEKLVIYGFGKHQDRTIELDGQLSILYGSNEAGKTTIQQFIIQTLFGFPARNQSLPRYEPKSGGKYGGQLHITDAVYGRVIIERVRGKSAGDVTVFFEDGTRGGDAELKMILRDYDRTSFESVFSFSIHELQGLERMTEEQLSRTLLASGTTGIDAVTKMESRLEKEMTLLFKKNGRNPEMNELIDELRDMEKDLKEFRGRTELYGPYITRLREIDRTLTEVTERENRLAAEMKTMEKWLQAAPLAEKKNALQAQIEELAITDFPADARRRMDRAVDRLSETAAKQEYLEQELARLKTAEAQLPEIGPLEQWMDKEAEWHQLRTALRQNQQEAVQLADDAERILALLGMNAHEALSADVSLNQQERLLAHIEQLDEEQENKRFLDRKLAEEKAGLAEAEKELKYFLAGEPPEQERRQAEEWQEVSVKLAEAKAASQLQKNDSPQTVNYILMALGAIGIIAGVIQSNYALAGIAALAAAAGFWFLKKSGKSAALSKDYADILQKYSGRETEYEQVVRKLEEYDRKLDGFIDSIDAGKRRLAVLSKEQHGEPARAAYGQFLRELGIQAEASRSTILQLFEKLRDFQAVHSKKIRITADIEQLDSELSDLLKEAAVVHGKPLSAETMFSVLRTDLEARRQHRSHQLKSAEKQAELQTEWEQLAVLTEQITREQQTLLDEAKASGVEDFYRLCDAWHRREQLVQQLAPVESQLAALGELQQPAGLTEDTAASYVADREVLLEQLKQQRNELLAEQAEKLQATKNLVSDSGYDEKLQLFEEKKEELAELARRWSIDKAIVEAIKYTMDELKEKKLPLVIAIAQKYFCKLTHETYSGLEMNPEGSFEAVRTDGMRFLISELSQATKEQAYLALRLSLAVSMETSHPFPIIMDDPFVHFDRRRLQQMINLIQELQKGHQFIYFTCHEVMEQAWPNARIIDVAHIERSVRL